MLSASLVAFDAAKLVVDYSFTNTDAFEVYYFSTLFHVNARGDRAPDPALVYVERGAPGEIVIGKYLVAIPRGMKVEAPEIPYLSLARPGETHAGRAVVPVPLRTYTPYSQSSALGWPENESATQLRFVLGVLSAATFPPRAAFVERAPPPPPDSFLCDYGLGVAHQKLFDARLALPNLGPPPHLP